MSAQNSGITAVTSRWISAGCIIALGLGMISCQAEKVSSLPVGESATSRPTSSSSSVARPTVDLNAHGNLYLSGPSGLNLKADLKLDLPVDFARQFKLPTKMKGNAALRFNAEELPPLQDEMRPRSHYTANVSLLIEPIEGGEPYIDYKTEFQGERDGTPSETVDFLLSKLMFGAELLTHPIRSQDELHPTTRP